MAAVRAMEITGLLLIAAAGGCGLLKIFVVKDKKIFPRVVAILAAIAGRCLKGCCCCIYSSRYFTSSLVPRRHPFLHNWTM